MTGTTPKGRGTRKNLIQRVVLITVAVIVLLVTPTVAHLYTDLLWYGSLGYESIFTTILSTRIVLGGVVGVLSAALIWVNLLLAMKLSRGLTGLMLRDPTGASSMPVGPIAARLVLPVALGIGLLVGLGASEHWETWLRYLHASDFGVADPIFDRDVGFYVFDLPALEALASLLSMLVGLTLVLVAAAYLARGGLVFTGRGLTAHRTARIHLSIVGVVLLLELAFEAWLAMPQLMYSRLGPVSGASYADVTARLPALQGQIVLTIIAAGLVGLSATRKKVTLTVAGVVLYLGVELLGARLYPSMVHRFSVEPNEAQKEAPYIRHNIDATRDAYGLADVAERELSGDLSIAWEDIEANRATVENIRLWDHEPLLDTFAQIQEIRTYYEFANVDNDRYVIDGKLRQTMLSPRELAAENLPNRTWINERFTFTHGYGITLGPVNVATNEGLPQLFVQDIPPTSEMETLEVTRPAIYFGELSNDYVFVRTANREFDFPQGEQNVYAEYTGSAGVEIGPLLTRAAVATRIASFKLLLSDDIGDESKVLLYRNVRQRVRKVAPFLRYDQDPYMVLRRDGTLVWIQDAYTTSARYPYAEPYVHPEWGPLNYVRNSVKVVVDAYDGSVDLYVADAVDPVLQTWRRIFPGIFKPLSEMPADLEAHLRYPEDIFRMQTEVFTVYHMDRAELVYNREDQWEIPSVQSGERPSRMVPYFTVMRLPGEEREEFIQMLPFTPAEKQNLSAWMVARMDGEHRGELIVYRFPKDRLVFGPQQVMNRINQDAEISRQISLWDQRGSEAILGTLLVIPIEESLIYVCPLYLRSEGGRIPELKRVITVYENRIAMEPTLDAAIAALFDREVTVAEVAAPPSGTADPPPPDVTEPGTDGATVVVPAVDGASDVAPEDPAAKARWHFDRAVRAQRAGDWAAYGEELEQLGEVLEGLRPAP